jgi:hypothetical protein
MLLLFGAELAKAFADWRAAKRGAAAARAKAGAHD